MVFYLTLSLELKSYVMSIRASYTVHILHAYPAPKFSQPSLAGGLYVTLDGVSSAGHCTVFNSRASLAYGYLLRVLLCTLFHPLIGCCNLLVENVELKKNPGATTPGLVSNVSYEVTFDFLGKKSMRYFNTVKVHEQVFKNLKLFMKDKNKEPKKPGIRSQSPESTSCRAHLIAGDPLFDRLDTPKLNKYLTSFMPGLTIKVVFWHIR